MTPTSFQTRRYLYNQLFNATFPLPHGVCTSAFAHRNPPRSLWLRHIHRMCRLTRRAHIPFPLCTSFEGTHGTAPRGDTLGARIIVTFLSLCHCALCAGYATTRRSRLYYTHKASTHKRQANDSAIYKMKAQSFV